jgi:hypothetical protein
MDPRCLDSGPRILWANYTSDRSEATNDDPSVLTRMGVRCGVVEGVEDCCRVPALWAGHPWNGCKTVSGGGLLAGRIRVGHGGWAGFREYMATPCHSPMVLTSEEKRKKECFSSYSCHHSNPLMTNQNSTFYVPLPSLDLFTYMIDIEVLLGIGTLMPRGPIPAEKS